MIKECPQYNYTFEEQAKRFPYFSEELYKTKNLELMRACICAICMDEQHTNRCPRKR